MRKLYLASFGFKVGDNEFEETRLVASLGANIETVTDDACLFWDREAEGTDRKRLSCKVLETLTEKVEGPSRENPLHRPSAYTLQEIFKELKFGRPSDGQHTLDRFIRELDRYKDDSLNEVDLVIARLDEFAEQFPELSRNIELAKESMKTGFAD